MTISCRCRDCGTPLRVKDQLAGKRIRCPHCGTAQAVGEPAGAGSPARPAARLLVQPQAEKASKAPPYGILGAAAALVLLAGALAAYFLWPRTPACLPVAQTPPQAPAPPQPVRYDGEWSGPGTGEIRVTGIVIDKEQFPCKGLVKVLHQNLEAQLPVLWARQQDELVGTDDRPDRAKAVIAQVRWTNGLLGGEITLPDNLLFGAGQTVTFAQFKRTGPVGSPKEEEPKKVEESPASVAEFAGKWRGEKLSGSIKAVSLDIDKEGKGRFEGTFAAFKFTGDFQIAKATAWQMPFFDNRTWSLTLSRNRDRLFMRTEGKVLELVREMAARGAK
jgi:hypothetical protein